MLRLTLLSALLIAMYALLSRYGAPQAALVLTVSGAFITGLILTLVQDS